MGWGIFWLKLCLERATSDMVRCSLASVDGKIILMVPWYRGFSAADFDAHFSIPRHLVTLLFPGLAAELCHGEAGCHRLRPHLNVWPSHRALFVQGRHQGLVIVCPLPRGQPYRGGGPHGTGHLLVQALPARVASDMVRRFPTSVGGKIILMVP